MSNWKDAPGLSIRDRLDLTPEVPYWFTETQLLAEARTVALDHVLHAMRRIHLSDQTARDEAEDLLLTALRVMARGKKYAATVDALIEAFTAIR